MTLYLPSLTVDELFRHASQCATTELEKELVRRLELLCRNLDRIAYDASFNAR